MHQTIQPNYYVPLAQNFYHMSIEIKGTCHALSDRFKAGQMQIATDFITQMTECLFPNHLAKQVFKNDGSEPCEMISPRNTAV